MRLLSALLAQNLNSTSSTSLPTYAAERWWVKLMCLLGNAIPVTAGHGKKIALSTYTSYLFSNYKLVTTCLSKQVWFNSGRLKMYAHYPGVMVMYTEAFILRIRPAILATTFYVNIRFKYSSSIT